MKRIFEGWRHPNCSDAEPARCDWSGAADPCRLTISVYDQAMATVGRRPAESGVLLGGYLGEGVVRHVFDDARGTCTNVTYSPDHESLNRVLKEWWNPAGIRFLGCVHSHPGRLAEPSAGDRRYAEAILTANPELPRLLLPIMVLEPFAQLFGFAAYRAPGGVRIESLDVVLQPEVLIWPQGLCRAAVSGLTAGAGTTVGGSHA
ncbi:MAG: Mov34/MPN/PAD-1 family protein [Candidatus Eisenbacteria bacterium]|nr:Mov34/MPN/PAD-1 family protein [Candidatus Eisenbacteria bacterium]